MARKNDLDSIVNYIHAKIMPITLNEKGKSKISNLLNQFIKEELRNEIDIGYEVYVHFDEKGEPMRDSVPNFLDKIGEIAHNNSLSPIDQKLRHLKNIGKKLQLLGRKKSNFNTKQLCSCTQIQMMV